MDGVEKVEITMTDPNALKQQIFCLTEEYYKSVHQSKEFVPGKSRIPYAGRVFDHQEMINLVQSALDFWLTAGPYTDQFEGLVKKSFGAEDFLLVNSGSSANLLMVSTLCSVELRKEFAHEDIKALSPGDEVITPTVTFPTTLAPIIQNRLIPVFVDCDVETLNINPSLIENAIGPRTKALLIPHTLGFPFDLDSILDIAKRHGLWLLEDSCDAFGAQFNGKQVGTFGAMSSLSFYPAHHMTMGEGGGVIINNPRLRKASRSMRDWGRDCWCPPGCNDTCKKRFQWKLGNLPYGYDHKYTYSNIGYNLKATDMQAAIGVAQYAKVNTFIEKRRQNYNYLYDNLKQHQDKLIFPNIDPRANPSPFGLPITVREGIDRRRMIEHLEDAKIETRLVFGGNILKQPGFMDIEHRVSGLLNNSDTIMNNSFFVGVYPGLTKEMLDYMIDAINRYITNC